jgi:alkylation response protein AidB-like acyl-CoA dehydrogenase
VLLEPTDDQTFFRETTARYLDDRAPVAELRRLRDDPAGCTPSYWRGGAELGWTTLLVSEAHGGGSISGAPVVDLSLVAYEFGTHAAPGPLIPTNLVAHALSVADTHLDVVAQLLAGEMVAAWCGEPSGTSVRVDGGDVVVSGLQRPVEAAAQAAQLLVAGTDGDRITQVLVPADAPGVSITALQTVDLTRRFAEVRLDDVRVPVEAVVGEPGGAGTALERQRQRALVMVNAEAVGAMQKAFDLTVEWAFDRYSFGRPLASYQALKHRFADMKTWLEASHAISDAAAAAVDAEAVEAGELVSVAKAYIGEFGSELVQDCVQLHGGIGVTYEHDLHLYLRRHTVDRTCFGTPHDHRRRVAERLVSREHAA